MTKVGIFGANGRMGRKLAEAIDLSEEVSLSGAVVRENSEFSGLDMARVAGLTAPSVLIEALSDQSIRKAAVWIDFTLPEALEKHVNYCVAENKNMVIGVTGLSAAQHDLLKQASEKIAIVYATNFSTGVNLMNKLLTVAARTMGQHCDIEIVEAHHRHKKDAPSGTALTMGESIAQGLGVNLADVAEYDRNHAKEARVKGSIGFSSLRAGDIVGEHTALFADIGERLEITHKATDRLTFAKGAVRAAAWLANKEKGLFDMQDVLEF